MKEGGLDPEKAGQLVAMGHKLRLLEEMGLESPPGTRLLVHAATLMKSGLTASDACEAAIVRPLTDDDDVRKAMLDIVEVSF